SGIRRHTRCLSDWSSDVCSSDLSTAARSASAGARRAGARLPSVSEFVARAITLPPSFTEVAAVTCAWMLLHPSVHDFTVTLPARSEERRVGKECRSWRAQLQYNS